MGVSVHKRAWQSVLIAGALAASGCSESHDPIAQTLVRVDAIAAGDPGCPGGGVRIHQGVDTSEDGVLDDAEITSTFDSCDQVEVLATSTLLVPGNSACPAGGYVIAYGLDDGDGGGTAGDGVLDPGEVDDLETLCDGSSLASPVGTDAPEGAIGANVIDASGGDSTTDQAGDGGDITVTTSAGVRHVQVFRTGTYAHAVALPTFDVDLGEVPLEITTDTTVTNLTVDPPNGVFYDPVASHLVIVEGGVQSVATGLHVAAGATLTLPNQADDDTLGIKLDADLHLEGTVTVGPGAVRDTLGFTVDQLRAAEGSTIDLVDGSNRSSLSVISWNGIASAADVIASGAGAPPSIGLLAFSGAITNVGDIDASGVDGASPSDGGSVSMMGYSRISNGGHIDTTGGSGTSGGAGGTVMLLAGTSNGGWLANTADIDTSGGSASSGNGGAGGSMTLLANGGALVSTGDLIASGGSGAAEGGPGGAITLTQSPIVGVGASQPIRFAGSIVTRGGSGNVGGQGGAISVDCTVPGVEAAVFYGVASIASDGGDATMAAGLGGDAGALSITLAPVGAAGYPTGAIVLRTDLSFTGGDGGGSGGAVTLVNFDNVEPYGTFAPAMPGIVLEGDADLSGGDDDDGAGGAGAIFTLDTTRSGEVVGSVTTRGGSSLDDSGAGADGGAIVLYALGGALSVTGVVDASGGDGSDGGSGGSIGVFAPHAVVDGDLVSTGGGGLTMGGDGGALGFHSTDAPGAVTGAIDLSGGAGGVTDGTDGAITGAI